ncbi:unnamed protein product [Tilletia laevis]|uniref:Uncharacterized protein n=3 Tax=Tilletia TaxID=13289 RepID=A0A8X7SYM2_9BASI|nr:hypothetical protein CF336_g2278 [Tilletia laevis]KAE8197207.1 hypothetical protein CF328_g3918 [Tilletia controversa]KAE8256501.1 hypothetical protein A4X03_0g5342 [Tilletia caries]KAE8202511.1 hypothetical protein CF335_g3390 [Tilletia laevis]KAE8250077.1 hypothetical protein A4X06_0g2936 [Tilletia controversa]
MEPPQRPTGWHPPAAAGVPGNLIRYASALEGAYLNSGRLSDGLARLNSVTLSLSSVSEHNVKEMERLHGQLLNDLQHLEDGVKHELTTAQGRLQMQVQGMQAQLQEELDQTHQRVHQQLLAGLRRIRGQMVATNEASSVQLEAAVSDVSGCAAQLRTDIQHNEADYMQALSQLLIYNSWTSAWPEA